MKRKALIFTLLLSLAPAALAQSVEGLAKGEDLPTLYELTAHSALVVTAKVLSGSVKLAQVQVEEAFRGDVRAGQHLQIAFRDLNLDLNKQDRVVFTDGETEILFLIPEVNWEGVRKGEDRYTLYRGRFGKVPLPREGDEIYLEALRVFATLTAQKDHRQLYAQIRGMLGSPNPILAETGLKETLRLELMDRSLLPVVLSYLQDPAPVRRSQALNLLNSLFRGLKPEEFSEDEVQDALSRAMIVARNDPIESVRIAAVEALGSWNGEEVLPTLKVIADQDPAQQVRYEAKVILLRREQAAKKNQSPAGTEPHP